MKKTRLGIIGLGRLGWEHARNIYYNIPEAELTAVCSVVDKELDTASELFDPKIVTKDYKDLLDSSKLDGIVIATNSQTHSEIICTAVEAGVKNIYTEKPLGLGMEEIVKIKNTIEKTDGLLFQVGYNHRFDKNLIEAKKKVDEGFVGKPILIRMESRDQAGIEEFIVKFSPGSGGFIADMMTHDYDTARWFTGSEAETIYGVGGVYAYEGLKACDDMDNTSILMKFKNGVMVILTASRNSAYGYHAPMEIFGTEGTINIGNFSYNSKNYYMNKDGVNRKCSKWFYEYWKGTYLNELVDFVGCIREGREPRVNYIDGYKAVEWALLADKAVRNEEIIKID